METKKYWLSYPLSKIFDQRIQTWMILFGGNILVMGLNFIGSTLLSHRILQSEFGSISFGLVLAGVTGQTARFAADRLLVRDILTNENEANTTIFASYFMRLIITLFALILLSIGLFFNFAPENWPTDVVFIFAIFGFTQGLLPNELYDCNRSKGMRLDTQIYVLVNIVFFGLLLLLMYTIPFELRTAKNIGLLRIFAGILQLTADFYFLKRKWVFPDIDAIKNKIKIMFIPYLKVFFPSIGSTLMVQYPTFFLESKYGSTIYAPYGIAMVLANVLCVLYLQLGRVMNPSLVMVFQLGTSLKEKREYLGKYYLSNIISSILICGICFLFSDLFFKLFFPVSYFSGSNTFKILILWVFIGTVIAYPIIQALLALGDYFSYGLSILIGLISTIIITPLLSIKSGIDGAAISLFLSNTIVVIVLFIQYYFKIIKND